MNGVLSNIYKSTCLSGTKLPVFGASDNEDFSKSTNDDLTKNRSYFIEC
jgi:hypothetical protein